MYQAAEGGFPKGETVYVAVYMITGILNRNREFNKNPTKEQAKS